MDIFYIRILITLEFELNSCMNLSKPTSLKLNLMYIVLALILSLFGLFLELLAIFDTNFKMTGILGNLFYLYLFIIESALFITCLYFYFKENHKYFSFNLVGAILAVVGSVLNILTIFAHFLLSIPPISEEPYASSWSVWNDISFIIIIGLLSIPFIIQVRKNISV